MLSYFWPRKRALSGADANDNDSEAPKRLKPSSQPDATVIPNKPSSSHSVSKEVGM